MLLGLSEVTTLMYFQRMNQRASYGPEGRASGAWIAGSIDLGQNLGDACHALRADGPVIQQAKDFLQHRDHPATDPPQGVASH